MIEPAPPAVIRLPQVLAAMARRNLRHASPELQLKVVRAFQAAPAAAGGPQLGEGLRSLVEQRLKHG